MNRGELWTVAGGVYAAKPRPALIIQDDLFSATESVVVVPLTMMVAEAPIARVAVPMITGIARPSFAMIDKITTVRRSNFGERIGRVSATLMTDIERSLMVFLGLAPDLSPGACGDEARRLGVSFDPAFSVAVCLLLRW